MADLSADRPQGSGEPTRRKVPRPATSPPQRGALPTPSNAGSPRGVEPDASDVIESREAFLAAISHELRSPITALKITAQVLVRQLDAPDEQTLNGARVLADRIDRQADKLTKLIEYLLDVSRSGSGSVAEGLHRGALG